MAGYTSTSEILDEHIPPNSVVVFDWDNTLKLYDCQTRTIKSRVDRQFLERLKKEKSCTLFVISAIRPSRMNMETLLLEMGRLGLTDIFADIDPKDAASISKHIVVVAGRYASCGNIIICGYDKSEVFLEVMSERRKRENWNSEGEETVVFFDDEVVNIENFCAIVKNSTCFRIVDDL